MIKKFIFLLVLIASPMLQARVFDYRERTISTYLRGEYGLINLQNYAFQPGFPTTVTFPSFAGANQSYSGEIGFGFQTKKINFRLGVEILNPIQAITPGVNSGGTTLLNMNSQVFSVIPKADLEVSLKETPQFKFYIGGGAGYAITSLKNTVSMTAAGTAALGVTDYIEEGTGYGILGEGFTGFEFLIFDNVGFSLDVGYRYLLNSSLNSNRDSFTPGNHETLGSTIINFGGGNRSLNLSGFFAAATFRIYIN